MSPMVLRYSKTLVDRVMNRSFEEGIERSPGFSPRAREKRGRQEGIKAFVEKASLYGRTDRKGNGDAKPKYRSRRPRSGRSHPCGPPGQGGHDVAAVDILEDHIEAIRRGGIEITGIREMRSPIPRTFTNLSSLGLKGSISSFSP